MLILLTCLKSLSITTESFVKIRNAGLKKFTIILSIGYTIFKIFTVKLKFRVTNLIRT